MEDQKQAGTGRHNISIMRGAPLDDETTKKNENVRGGGMKKMGMT